MKRLLWLGIGLAVGALVVRAVSRKARAFTPGGIAAAAQESAFGVVEGVRTFVSDVRDGMAEREADIRAALAEGIELDEDLYPVEEGKQYR
jgi:hypothetical protein